MVEVSCLLVMSSVVLLAVRPTSELFLRKPISVASDGEGLVYERDKPNEKTRRLIEPRRRRHTDVLMFIEEEEKEELRFFVPKTDGPPACARGGTFCEAVDKYPSEHVMRILRKEPVFVRSFLQDDKKIVIELKDVEDRIDISEENPLCASQEHTVYPKMAKNIEGNWMFVINQDEYVQGVRVEKCLNNHECSMPANLATGYRSQCKQKYIYRKLVALNSTGQGVISDTFQFPSCCSCVIKLDRHLAHNRFSNGGGGGLAALPLTLLKTTPAPLPKN